LPRSDYIGTSRTGGGDPEGSHYIG